MKKILRKIKIWTAKELFKLFFGTFYYPFDQADWKYERMNTYKKVAYLKAIKDWYESDAYKIESQEILRRLYRDLAIKPHDELLLTAYRLAILIEQDKQKRLRHLSQKYELLNIIE